MTEASDLYRRVETECPAFQARVTARALTRYYNAWFRPLGITAEQFSLLVGIGGSHEPTLAELAARAGVDATTLSRSVKGLELRNLVLDHGGWGRTGKRLVLTDAGRRLMDESVIAWECARGQLTEFLGEDASRVAGSVMSQLAVAAQAAALAVSPTKPPSTKEAASESVVSKDARNEASLGKSAAIAGQPPPDCEPGRLGTFDRRRRPGRVSNRQRP